MIAIEVLRELSEEGKLTAKIVDDEIRERRDVMSRLVGHYQMTLAREITEIKELVIT